MHRKLQLLILLTVSILPLKSSAQLIVLESKNMDTTKPQITAGILLDIYYGYSATGDSNITVPYFVSSSYNRQTAINLAYLNVQLKSQRVRATISPALGTYMNANYAAEPNSFGHFFQANAGIKLSSKKDIWLDAGLFDSPYSNEGPVSSDNLVYTRALGAENVPYYLFGAKISIPVSNKLFLTLMLLNGWQQIKDVNNKLSFGSSLLYKLSAKHSIYWNTYCGNEQSNLQQDYRNRYFNDVYWNYTGKKLSLTAGAYFGLQKINGSSHLKQWYQANIGGLYKINKALAVSGRVEYFQDKENVFVTPVTNVSDFSAGSATLCINNNLTDHALLRLEARGFFSKDKVFVKNNYQASQSTTWFTLSLAIH